MLRVLLTNDDGIDAEGLQTLRRALVALDDIELAVVAPDGNRSATARSITVPAPAVGAPRCRSTTARSATRATARRWTASGSRALGLIEGFEPDVIVSGINHGANLGDDITYSGTVAAALEGIVLGIPGIAVSQQSDARARWTSGSATCSTSRTPPRSRRRSSTASTTSRCPPARCSTSTCPPGEIERRRGGAARQARLPGPAGPDRGGRPGRKLYRVYGDVAAARRRAGHRPRGGRRRADRRHAAALRPDRRARDGGAARVRPRAAARGG